MRNLKMVLAMVAILAMASTSFAGVTIAVLENASPAEGLSSYNVLVGGAQAFADVNIAGGVVQSNMFQMDWDTMEEEVVPTVWLAGMPTAFKAIDTHYLFAMPGIVVPGAVFTETNDKSNQGGIAPAYGYYAGLGTFGCEPGSGFALAAPLADNSPFLQVVIPTGSSVVLSFMAPVDGVDTQFSQVIGVPEPGTIMLVIAGALCLLVARYRRK